MLQIEDHLPALGFAVGDGVPDHFQVLRGGGAQYLLDVGLPGFPHDGHRRSLGSDQGLDVGIRGGLAPGGPGGPEGHQFGVFQGMLLEGLEVGRLFFVGEGEAPFDVVHLHLVQHLGDLDLVLKAEGDLHPLHTVPEGGVVDGYRQPHITLPSS